MNAAAMLNGIFDDKESKMDQILDDPLMDNILNIARDEGYIVDCHINYNAYITIKSDRIDDDATFNRITMNIIERIIQEYNTSEFPIYYSYNSHNDYRYKTERKVKITIHE